MKKTIPRLILGIGAALLFSVSTVFAQTDSLSDDISLEDLMNVKIVSVSKKAENLFDASLSASSVSREEIKRAGATSIMEALRLVPGVMVTESTNGNYQVNLRGFSNLPEQSALNSATNSITLVMIDNRPVYNYFNGGTFWESLPIDLNDVEKIEVVRGPAAAVYGPNAAAGVINIITRRPEKEGLYTVANAQLGVPNQAISNASVGYKKDKFDFIVSGNQQYRTRTETDYYSWVDNKKENANAITTSFPAGALLADSSGNPNASKRYPHQSTSMNKYGYNAFLNYKVSQKALISMAFGGEKAMVQKAFIENLATPLSTSESNTKYMDLKGKFNHFSIQGSYLRGTQNEAVGQLGYKYDFNTLDANADYDFVYKGFSIKPGVSYRRASYDDSKYAHVSTNQGFLGGQKVLENYSGSLRSELNVAKIFKFTAAGRLDGYNHPNKGYLSYQLGATAKLNEKNLVRFVASRAYKGPNMYDTYSSNNIFVGTQGGLPFYAQVQGDKNLKMQSVNMLELGYRVKATDNLYFDLEIFNQISQNFTYLVSQPTVVDFPVKVTVAQSVENIQMKAIQNGATLSANWVLKKFQIKPFITVQSTNLKKVPLYRDSPAAAAAAGNPTQNITVTTNQKDKGTPNYYGGAYINFAATSKLNINVTGYYYSNYVYSNIYNSLYNSGNPNPNPNAGIAKANGVVLINAKVSYKFFNKLDLFVAAKNIMNNTSYEFAHTDKILPTFLVGGNFEF
jgi:iron complex outermembrane receptor protein